VRGNRGKRKTTSTLTKSRRPEGSKSLEAGAGLLIEEVATDEQRGATACWYWRVVVTVVLVP